MNLLCDTLPSYIECDGKKYEIKTDFKVWLKFYSVMTNKNLNNNEKLMLSVLCCFDASKCRRLPPDSEKTMQALLEFFGGGSNKSSEEGHKILDFSEDADLIFAAFYQEYGIDLTSSDMHWYKFLALLKGLTDRTQLIKIIEYRSVDLSQITDRNKRSFYRKMKNIYALSNDAPLSENEIAKKMASVF